MKLTFHKIKTVTDPLLLPFLDLYEQSFPQAERFPVSIFLKILIEPRSKSTIENDLIAVIDEDGHLVGMGACLVNVELRLVYLMYLAVQPEYHSHGLGTEIYHFICSEAAAHGRGVFFEVEIPELAANPVERQLRTRRIDFYRRQGAQIFSGVHYTIQVTPSSPQIPMLPMVHLHEPVQLQDLYTKICQVNDTGFVEQTGPLSLA